MSFQPVPHRPPILRRRFHHHFAHPMLLQPGRQVADLALGRPKFTLDVRRCVSSGLTNHHRQHLLVHVDASDTLIYCVHNVLLVIAAQQRTGFVYSHPHGFSRRCDRQDPHSTFRPAVPDQTLLRLRHIQCVRQPRLPRATYIYFHHYPCAQRNINTLACSVHTRVNATSFTASLGRISTTSRETPKKVKHP